MLLGGFGWDFLGRWVVHFVGRDRVAVVVVSPFLISVSGFAGWSS